MLESPLPTYNYLHQSILVHLSTHLHDLLTVSRTGICPHAYTYQCAYPHTPFRTRTPIPTRTPTHTHTRSHTLTSIHPLRPGAQPEKYGGLVYRGFCILGKCLHY